MHLQVFPAPDQPPLTMATCKGPATNPVPSSSISAEMGTGCMGTPTGSVSPVDHGQDQHQSASVSSFQKVSVEITFSSEAKARVLIKNN